MIRLNLLAAEHDAAYDGFRRWAVLVLLGSAAVGIFAGVLWLDARSRAALDADVDQLRAATDAALARLAVDRRREEQFTVVARATAEFRAAPQTVADLVSRLDAFAALLPDEAWCETIEVGAGHVGASGKAAEGKVVNSLLDRLVHVPHPQRIELTSASDPESSGYVPFSLRMSSQLPTS